jgi:hypothetical protein
MEAGFLILLVMYVLRHQQVIIIYIANTYTLTSLLTLQPTVVILPFPQTVILSLIQALQRGQGSTEFTSVRMDQWKLKKMFVILMDNGKLPGAELAPQSQVYPININM